MTNFTNNEQQIIDRFNAYKAFAKEALLKEQFCYSDRCMFERYPEIMEAELCRVSQRYTSLVKIEAIIAKPGFEVRLHAYGDKLQAKCFRLFEKLTDEITKSSCHWRREGYDSKEEYAESLWNGYVYETTNGYALSVTENLFYDLYHEILKEYIDLCY